MKQKKFLTFTLVLSLILVFSIGTIYSQVKPIKKPGAIKTLKPALKVIKGTVFEINCNDNYLKIYGPRCAIYKIGITSAKCNALNLSLYDKVKVTARKSRKKGMRIMTTIKALKVIKIAQAYLKCKVKVVNCNDEYLDLEYRICRKLVSVRVGVPRNKCVRYNLNAGDQVKVYGNISYDYSNRRIVINNVTNIVKY